MTELFRVRRFAISTLIAQKPRERTVAAVGSRRSAAAWPTLGLLGLAWLAMGVTPALTHADESLGEVRLSLRQTDPGGVTASNKPRLAVLLIDQTGSMKNLENPNQPKSAQNANRWDVMNNGVRQALEQLLTHAKGVKVRLRFFDNTATPHREDDFEILDSPTKIDALLRRIPQQPGEGATALFDATTKIVDDIQKEHRREGFEWIFFGLFSDGADTNSKSATKKDRDATIQTFKTSGVPAEYFAFPIGTDTPRDAYGPEATVIDIRAIARSIPKPPVRPPQYVLDLAPNQPKLIGPKQSAKQGTYSLGVSLLDDHKAVPNTGMRLIPRISAGSAMRIPSQGLVVGGPTPATLALDVPAGTDVSKGLSAEITFEPDSAAPPPFVCSGTTRLRIAFEADELLPKDKWQGLFPRAVKRGESATFFLDPGKATGFTWVFTGPGGVTEKATPAEKQFETKFETAGTWTVEYSCMSQTDNSKRPSKKLHDLEVVDAEFHLEPARTSIDPGTPVTITIVPNPGATSKATYKAEFDDAAIPIDGNKIVVSGKKLMEDTHFLTVTASVDAGGKTFTFQPQKAIIKVKPGAQIIRLRRGQPPLKPGEAPPLTQESLPPGLESVFQVTNIDLTKVESIEWTYNLPGEQQQTQKGSDDLLHLTPAECGPLVIRANVSMKDVKTLAPVEAHFDVGGTPPSATPRLIPDVTALGMFGTTVTLHPGIEGTCKKVSAWLVQAESAADGTRLWEQTFDPHQKHLQIVLPREAGQGKYKVHLRAEPFRGCQPWQLSEPLTLTLTPRPMYERWLVSVALLGGLGWLIYAWLWGNDALRWWIDFSFVDPGPPTTNGGGSYMLYVGEAASAPVGHRTNYLGWNRWRKQAFVPLWLFADRADSTDASWLNDPRWSATTLKLVNVWKNPFKLTGDLAVGWKSEYRYGDLDGAEPISRTLWLQPPWDGAGAPPAIWLRMHCPRGGDPYLWFLWTWLAFTILAAGLLLPYFNIFTF